MIHEQVEVVVRGVTVRGHFLHRSPHAIEVGILEPHDGFSLWLHMTSYSRTGMPDGLNSSEGMTAGRKLLRDLYRAADYLDAHRAEVMNAYRQYTSLIAEIHVPPLLDDERFTSFKTQMNEMHANGSLSDADYRRHMRQCRENHSRYHEQLWTVREEFFKLAFPFTIPAPLQEQILAVLKRGSVNFMGFLGR